MPKNRKFPDRWLDYSNIGGQIPGTPFVAFKVPLNENVCRSLPPEQRFDPRMVIDLLPNLGMVIDLTNTDKYYKPWAFTSVGIRHEKLCCQGGVVPAARLVREFFNAVDEFTLAGPGRLIGVHCTHGLNRTGFFICYYMIEKLGFTAQDAIKTFNAARGHRMERGNYIQTLTQLLPNKITPELLQPLNNIVHSRSSVASVPGTSWRSGMRESNYEADRPRQQGNTGHVHPNFRNPENASGGYNYFNDQEYFQNDYYYQ